MGSIKEMMMPKAFIAARGKKGLDELAQALTQAGYAIYGSAGVAAYLHTEGLPVGNPEALTSLYGQNPMIDVLYVDLYPLDMELENPARTITSLMAALGSCYLHRLIEGLGHDGIVICQQSDLREVCQLLRAGKEFPEALKVRLRLAASQCVSIKLRAVQDFIEKAPIMR